MNTDGSDPAKSIIRDTRTEYDEQIAGYIDDIVDVVTNLADMYLSRIRSLEADLAHQREVNEIQAYTIRRNICSYTEGKFVRELKSEIEDLLAHIEELEADLRAYKEDSETLAKDMVARQRTTHDRTWQTMTESPRMFLHGVTTCWYESCPECGHLNIPTCSDTTSKCPECGHTF